jgi:hypothetical protein
MARRTRIIEGTWNCTSCGTQGVLGRHKVCPQCGNPRERGHETQFDFGATTESGASTKEAVTEAALLQQAALGPDWRCSFCQATNAADLTVCRACAAPRAESPEEPAPPEQAASVQDLVSAPTAETPQPAGPASLGRRRGCLGCALALGVALVALLILSIWGAQRHEYEGRVMSRSWERVVHREGFVPVTKDGWRDEVRAVRPVMPVNGAGAVAGVTDVRDCHREQRGTRRVADGTERVCRNVTRRVACGTREVCRKKDLGNGFAQEVCEDVTKYCDKTEEECQQETRYREEPVYDTRCRYTTWEWQPNGEERASGHDDDPRWPALSAGAHDRLRREGRYGIDVEYSRRGQVRTHTLTLSSEAEYRGFRTGQPLTVVVNNLGVVKDVRPR